MSITNNEAQTVTVLRGHAAPAVEDPESAYGQAHVFMEHFTQYCLGEAGSRTPDRYDDKFSTQMHLDDFLRLREEFNPKGDQSYPRFEFDSSSSTVYIQCFPTNLHDFISSVIDDQFYFATRSLPAPIQRNISASRNYCGITFRGKYRRSVKISDLAFKFPNAAGDIEPKFIFQVGTSKTYEDLVRHAKLWLEGKPEVSVVVVAKLVETPSFQYPTSDEQLSGLLEASQIRGWNFTLERENGPVSYKGVRWAGNMSEAFVEVWKRHPGSGLATQIGNRINLLQAAPPAELTFRWSEFLDIAPEDDSQISFNLQGFQERIEMEIRQLAVSRCGRYFIDRAQVGMHRLPYFL